MAYVAAVVVDDPPGPELVTDQPVTGSSTTGDRARLSLRFSRGRSTLTARLCTSGPGRVLPVWCAGRESMNVSFFGMMRVGESASRSVGFQAVIR